MMENRRYVNTYLIIGSDYGCPFRYRFNTPSYHFQLMPLDPGYPLRCFRDDKQGPSMGVAWGSAWGSSLRLTFLPSILNPSVNVVNL